MIFAKDQCGNFVRAGDAEDGFCPGCGEKLLPKIGMIKTRHWAHYQKDCDTFYEPETWWHQNWKSMLGLKNCEKVVRFSQEYAKSLFLFGLDRSASKDEVIARYHVLIHKWHPDRIKITGVAPEVALERTKHLNAVYEVLMKNDFSIFHRADVMLNGTVIELQSSAISPYDIMARERFYGKMIWILDAETIGKNFELRQKKYGINGKEYYTFRWKYPHISIWSCSRTIYFDLSYGMRTDLLFRVRKMYCKIPCGGWGDFCEVV